MLNTFEVNKVLIIAPLRVARDTWTAEIEKWDHLKYLDISVIVGDAKTRIAAVHHPALVYIINRENIKWLVEYYEKNGMRWDFSMVVIDELSSFKNHQSLRFRSLRKVRPFVKRWVGLTGTPSSNGLMDLWAEIGILDGGVRLGKFIGHYREAYFKAGSLNPATGVVFQYVPREGAEKMIYQRISDITISMKALDYLNMPDCVPTRYEVEMNTDERKLYDMLKHDLLIPLKDGDIDAANAASLTGKLLQMSNGAVYDENGKARVIHDHKLEALEDLIEAANGQMLARLESIQKLDFMERDRAFYKKQIAAAHTSVESTNKKIRLLKSQVDVMQTRLEILGDEMIDPASIEEKKKLIEKLEQGVQEDMDTEQKLTEQLDYMENYWEELESDYERREKAIEWMKNLPAGRDGTVAFLNEVTEEHCKAFILSITIHSPLKFTVHWFDDTKTEVQMDSNIEDYRNTASYYDGHTMRDGSQRKKYVRRAATKR